MYGHFRWACGFIGWVYGGMLECGLCLVWQVWGGYFGGCLVFGFDCSLCYCLGG